MSSEMIRSFILGAEFTGFASLSMPASVTPTMDFHPCDTDITKMQEPTDTGRLSQVRQPQAATTTKKESKPDQLLVMQTFEGGLRS